MNCRFCHQPLKQVFLDLGVTPLSNSFLTKEQLPNKEAFYPLKTYICDKCFLVQLDEFESPEAIFSDYAYFSSYSTSWLNHCHDYADKMVAELKLNQNSLVMEVASNDGYLLQFFNAAGVPVLGIEPAANVAAQAIKNGINTRIDFFNSKTARDLCNAGQTADLLIGNNVLAHVPELNDFVSSLKMVLNPDGVITMEFPHLMRLIDDIQFDTIYHEHFSYFSYLTVENIFASHGLTIYDVEELPTHGGSLRIYAGHQDDKGKVISPRITELKNREMTAGYLNLEFYLQFQTRVFECKRQILAFLITAKNEGKSIVAYGAPAKGNTLLNYCGTKDDFIDYVVDKNTYKQGKYLPGTRLPIIKPDAIFETKPDLVLILPWNLQNEVMEQMRDIKEWGGQFVVTHPELKVL